jgi:flagellar basal body-associated protein FliL
MPPETETQPKMSKKTAIIILVIILALLGIGWYVFKKQKQKTAPPAGPSQEEVMKQQMAELDALRQAAGDKEPTPEEIQKQLKELDKLRGQ